MKLWKEVMPNEVHTTSLSAIRHQLSSWKTHDGDIFGYGLGLRKDSHYTDRHLRLDFGQLSDSQGSGHRPAACRP